MAIVLQTHSVKAPSGWLTRLGWLACAIAPWLVFAHALQPPTDTALLLALSVVFGTVGLFVLTLLLARLACQRWNGPGRAKFESAVESMVDAASDGRTPCGPLM